MTDTLFEFFDYWDWQTWPTLTSEGIAQAETKAQIETRLHDLRHTCRTHLLVDGNPIETVQELMGHTSITVTQIYAKAAAERLKKVKLSY
jgi:site-specific recombinase XerD